MIRTKAVLIVGGSGFIGTHLALALRDKYKVFATYAKHPIRIPGVSVLPFHVADRNWMKRVAYNIQPDIVVYAAGNPDADKVELDIKMGDQVHTRGVAGIVAATDIFQPKFILLSSAYVFDGMRGNYKENDTQLPLMSLGKYKVSAENYLKSHSLNYVIIRSSPLYGRGNGISHTFMDVLRRSLARKEQIQVKANELHSFAPIDSLVDTVVRVIETGTKNRILHCGGLTKLTHFEFAQEFAEKLGYDTSLIHADTKELVKTEGKPLDYSLNSSQTLQNLKLDAFVLEHGLDLLQKKLIA